MPTILVICIWLYAAGTQPKLAYVQTPTGAVCEAARVQVVEKISSDPTVRYVEGHCYTQGDKA
jgi:hypothetical protein